MLKVSISIKFLVIEVRRPVPLLESLRSRASVPSWVRKNSLADCFADPLVRLVKLRTLSLYPPQRSPSS